MNNKHKLLKKLFGISSLTELLFVLLIAIFIATVTIINYNNHFKRYHVFQLDSNQKTEFFIEEIDKKTLLIYKDINPIGQTPRIHFKIIENNLTIKEGQININQFELSPSSFIFEEFNNSLNYYDQYQLKLSKTL